MQTSRTHTATMLTPAGTGRRRARQRRREAADLASRVAADAPDRRRNTSGRGEAAAAWLPRSGERGPAALRSWLPFRVPPHAATSATLAGAYPFLAEQGLGSAGVLIGTDLLSGGAFVYDPWVLYRDGVITNPNVLLAGVIGTGKSALAKSLTTRSLAFGVRVYVPGDPKGEWTPVARAVGGVAITLGHGRDARLNPLDAGTRPTGLTDVAWDGLVWQSLAQARGAWGEQAAAAMWDAAITKIVLGGGSNARDLADLAALIGDRDETTTSTTRGHRGERSTSTSIRRVPVMDTSRLRTLPFGTAVLLLRTAPPIVLDLAAWTHRPDAADLRAGRSGVEARLRDAAAHPGATTPRRVGRWPAPGGVRTGALPAGKSP